MVKSLVTTCTFQDLGLNKINNIIVQHIFNPTNSLLTSSNPTNIFDSDLTQAILASIATTIQNYENQINQAKTKLQNTKENIKKPGINIDKVIEAIEKREMNMKQRAQYQAQYKIKLLLSQ